MITVSHWSGSITFCDSSCFGPWICYEFFFSMPWFHYCIR